MGKKRERNETVLRITDRIIFRNDVKGIIFELFTTFVLKEHETRENLREKYDISSLSENIRNY